MENLGLIVYPDGKVDLMVSGTAAVKYVEENHIKNTVVLEISDEMSVARLRHLIYTDFVAAEYDEDIKFLKGVFK